MTDRDKLRERVADVIVKSWDEDEEYNSFKCADAAIAVVLEEAARVAEECAPVSQDTWSTELAERCDMVAAAIRALKGEKNGM